MCVRERGLRHETTKREVTMNTYSASRKCNLYLFQTFYRAPAFSNEASVGHVQVKHIHSVVDPFYFCHLQQIMNNIIIL